MDDSTPMPFGKHKGERMENVPDSYLAWLWDDGIWDMANDTGVRGDLHDYIKSSLSEIGKKYVIKHQPKR